MSRDTSRLDDRGTPPRSGVRDDALEARGLPLFWMLLSEHHPSE